jgi:hypothetical protein
MERPQPGAAFRIDATGIKIIGVHLQRVDRERLTPQTRPLEGKPVT